MGRMKPALDFFHEVLRLLGGKAANYLFIDDSIENVWAAEMMGIRSVQFQSARQLRRVLTELGFALDS